MNQLELNLEPTPKQLCCICGCDLEFMAFNKDWMHGNNPNTSGTHYPEGSKCCDLCNRKVVAKRLEDHKGDKIRVSYSEAEDFLNEMGSDYDKY